jgi:Phosphoribosylformylglycinamidine (FGAM) synthase, glutamine amidotransferase domain
MPFGGKYQLTPSSVMAARLPVLKGDTRLASAVSWAFDPRVTEQNPYAGGIYSIVTAIAKLVAAGIDYKKIRLTLQEFFKRLNGDETRFGEPAAALLGALNAQYNLGVPAIGGKDSMSGSFEHIDVPNTLIAFAVALEDSEKLISNVFSAGDKIYRIPLYQGIVPDYEKLKNTFEKIREEIHKGNITAACVSETGGAAAAVVKCAVGNKLGVRFLKLGDSMFSSAPSVIAAIKGPSEFERIAEIDNVGGIGFEKDSFSTEEAVSLLSVFEKIYPTVKEAEGRAENVSSDRIFSYSGIKAKTAKPRVILPVFPGTNCEYDTARRFGDEGGEVKIFVIKNRNAREIAESVKSLASEIDRSQILAFPGGFSGGDEPDGSGKFIAATFRNPYLKEAVARLINERDGLVLGICNGFQALIKLGLVPYGKITGLDKNSPTLTFNAINRHVSTIVNIRIASTASPWLSSFKVGDVFSVPVSHGEGRFASSDEEYRKILTGGQIATQYCDLNGDATMLSPFNPNGSLNAVEGLVSPDGRVFGKMGHPERYREGLFKNVKGNYDMNIFKNGIEYFR